MTGQRQLNACVRAVNFRVPMIRKHVSKAAHGPLRSARHQLDETIRHVRGLLDELQIEQAALGWQKEDVA